MEPVEPLVLAGFVEGVDGVLNRKYFADLAASLQNETWPIAPPQPADDPDAGLGLLLQGPSLDSGEPEQRAFDAAGRLLALLAEASALSDATIAVEYDGEVIGWIEGGRLDDALSVGFLGEWRKAIDGSQ